MASGVVSCTLTFTFINPTFATGANPISFTVDLPWVDHLAPLRASMLPSGSQFSGIGWCKRKGVAEAPFAIENQGQVDCETHADLGLRAYLDCATAPIILLRGSFNLCDGFQSCLVDLSRQINGVTGEEDHL